MKILIVHNAYGRISGEEIVIDNLVALLAARGVTVQRFSRYSEEIEAKGLGKISAFFSGIHNQFSKAAFGHFLRETRPDIVHIHNLYPLISPSILPECTAQGVPVVMTVHNFRLACPNGLLMSHGVVCHRCLGGREYWCILRNCEDSLFKSIGYALRTAAARVLRRYYDHVDHYVCLTRFQRDILVKEGLPQERVSVLPNPVEIKVAEPSVEVEKNSVLFVGRVSREKGIASLFNAAGVCFDIPFVVAGSRQAMPVARELAPGNVTLLGPVPSQELGALYENACIFVLPSVCYEGFPTVLLEAMSHGLPVVCSRIGGLPEIVEEGKTGLLYEPGNADELADRIRTLWQNPALCKKLGDAGRRKVREDYAADKLLDRLLGIYEKVIVENRGRKSEDGGQRSESRGKMQINSAKDLDVYKHAYTLAMEIFQLSKRWPAEEKYALIDQVRRSSRSVCSNLREAWAKRRYAAHFISKLTDCDGENSETDTWLDFACTCGYLSAKDHERLTQGSKKIGGMLGSMLKNPSAFIINTDL